MPTNLPPWLVDLLQGSGLAVVGGVIGRLLWHAEAVRKGLRKPLSWHLLWELPVAVGMGVIGDGLASWLGLAGKPAVAVIAVCSFLGPHALLALFGAGLDRVRVGGSGPA